MIPTVSFSINIHHNCMCYLKLTFGLIFRQYIAKMIRVARDHDHTSMATDKLFRRQTLNKQEELSEAVQWCREKGCKGFKALTAVGDEGKFLVRVHSAEGCSIPPPVYTVFSKTKIYIENTMFMMKTCTYQSCMRVTHYDTRTIVVKKSEYYESLEKFFN